MTIQFLISGRQCGCLDGPKLAEYCASLSILDTMFWLAKLAASKSGLLLPILMTLFIFKPEFIFRKP